MKIRKAFTLVEILMVVLIVGILVGVLFKVYITMSQIFFRVEQQKIVNQELLFVSEMIQNFANRNEIDYSKYGTELVNSKGFSDVLYLTGEDGETAIYATGSCVFFGEEIIQDNLNIGCNLVMKKGALDSNEIKLTHDLVYTTKTLFKIVPFATKDMYVVDMNLCDSNYLACTNDPGFWVITNIYSKGYQRNIWANEVSIFVNQFFNI